VGDKMSLADIVVASALVYPMKLLMDASFRAPFPNTMRWFNTCVNQPEFKAVIGEVVLCVTETAAPSAGGAAPAKAPAAEKAAAPAEGGKKGKKDKKEKQPGGKPDAAEIERLKAEAAERKKNAPPKEKKEEPKKKKEAAPPVQQAPPAKKAEHPYKIMDREAPSDFDSDAWKKIYSNCQGDYAGAMKQFWELHDSKGWSLHTCRYKYNSENGKAFMVSNAINGFIQRSGEIRKWLFGVMWVTGEEGLTPLEISGCFLIRGQDVSQLVAANDDAEHYNWYKVETDTDEGKSLVHEMWCSNDGKFEYLEGKKCIACSEFK
jgi:elongation factor 1-gamma